MQIKANTLAAVTLFVTVFCLGAQADAAKAQPEVAEVSVEKLAAMLDKKECVTIDANGKSTREKYGVIPGAIELSSYDTYDVAKELPADKNAKLIFYCGSKRCTAAPQAAIRAKEAGYTNVAHLKVGIKGWVKAGKKVSKKS